MSIIAEVRLSSPQLALAHTIRTASDVRLETVYHVATSATIPYLFYAARGEEYAALETALADDPSVFDAVAVDNFGDRRIYRVELSGNHLLVAPRLAELGGALLEAYSHEGGWNLKINLPDRDCLVAFKGYCEDEGIDFELRRLYMAENGDGEMEYGLTPAQREALVTAYARGYFEEPRAVSLADLGEELGVSSTAVGGRIRRAMAHLIETMVVSGPEGT